MYYDPKNLHVHSQYLGQLFNRLTVQKVLQEIASHHNYCNYREEVTDHVSGEELSARARVLLSNRWTPARHILLNFSINPISSAFAKK